MHCVYNPFKLNGLCEECGGSYDLTGDWLSIHLWVQKHCKKKKKPFTVILLSPHIQINLDAFSRRSMVEAQGSF